VNFLGIEWAREFYLYAADRVRRAGLKNVRMLRADATEFLRWRCPGGIVSVIHLYFSDPWPKKKHHKNRVVQDRFLAEVWRVLKSERARERGNEGGLGIADLGLQMGATPALNPRSASADTPSWGELRVVTDHEELWEWDMEHFRRWTSMDVPAAGWKGTGQPPFELVPFTPPAWVGEGQLVGTNYERKMCVGREPFAGVLRKRG
jgi:tRNA (guanine-N7-)-methyltransferase